jgi:hypothetical protein
MALMVKSRRIASSCWGPKSLSRRTRPCSSFGALAAGAAEGGHFQQVLAEHHVHDLEALADDEGAPEQALDLLRRGVGGDVEVLRLHAQQQVAHRAADDKRLEAGFLQGAGDAHRVRGQQLRVDLVLGRVRTTGWVRSRAGFL